MSIISFYRKAVLIFVTLITMSVVTSTAYASTIEDTISKGVDSVQTQIDISSCNVTPEEAVKAYVNLKNTNPYFFYAGVQVDCKYDGSKAKTLVVSYNASKTDIQTQKKAVDSKANSIAELAKSAATNAEKAQIVHDYFINNTKYSTNPNATVYDLLVNNQGVCTSYALSYKLVMDKLGIPCGISVSTAMNHEWNVIQIDGKWYNVDITYDVSSGIGGNGNFLKSDSMFKIIGHTSWINSNGVVCTDTKYDSNF